MFSDSDTDTVTTKEETKIAVYATFVSTCLGAKHVPVIDNPIDLSSTLGFVTSYDDLFQKLKLYVESPTDETEETEKTDFHHDKKHTYTFEPKKLSKGCIWGLKNKRNDGDEKSRMTKSKLEPITSAEQFTDYISDCGVKVYKETYFEPEDSDSDSESVPDGTLLFIEIELCIILMKEFLSIPKPVSRNRRSLENSSSSSRSRKRNKEDTKFKFKARSLAIELFAPVETYENSKDNSRKTHPPSGSQKKTNLEFDLEEYIEPYNPHAFEDHIANVGDEIFKDELSLAFFRVEMMKIAVRYFPGEYSIERRAILMIQVE